MFMRKKEIRSGLIFNVSPKHEFLLFFDVNIYYLIGKWVKYDGYCWILFQNGQMHFFLVSCVFVKLDI